MKFSSSPEKAGRFFLSRRFLALAGVSLLAIGLALFAVFMDRGGKSARFDELREGMEMAEVLGVLKPAFVAPLPPASGVTTMTAMQMFKEPALSADVFSCYQESPLFPGFTATLTFEKGYLTKKELHAPGIRDILQYWWHQVWERVKR